VGELHVLVRVGVGVRPGAVGVLVRLRDGRVHVGRLGREQLPLSGVQADDPGVEYPAQEAAQGGAVAVRAPAIDEPESAQGQGGPPRVQQQAAVGRHFADGPEVVAGQPDAKHRGLRPECPRGGRPSPPSGAVSGS
jgi:hypothetical protein